MITVSCRRKDGLKDREVILTKLEDGQPNKIRKNGGRIVSTDEDSYRKYGSRRR
jgi:hypothetical protein